MNKSLTKIIDLAIKEKNVKHVVEDMYKKLMEFIKSVDDLMEKVNVWSCKI